MSTWGEAGAFCGFCWARDRLAHACICPEGQIKRRLWIDLEFIHYNRDELTSSEFFGWLTHVGNRRRLLLNRASA